MDFAEHMDSLVGQGLERMHSQGAEVAEKKEVVEKKEEVEKKQR